jgi:hypothetical protein
LILILLPLFCAIAFHIILFTDLPKTVTEKSLREKLQTEVTIKKLKTEWEGYSHLTGVSIRLPVKRKCFLNIESVRVKHNNPVELLIGKNLKVSSLKAEGAKLRLYQKGIEKDVKALSVGNAEISIAVKDLNSDNKSISTIMIEDKDLGHIDARASFKDNLININRIDGRLFEGDFTASAVVEPNQWDKTQINVSWKDLDIRQIGRWWPKADELLGVTSGKIEIKPSESRRPLEPLAVNGHVNMKGKIFKDLKTEGFEFNGAIGLKRILLTGFEMTMLDGYVRGNARVSKKADGYFFYTNWNLDNIDVNEVAAFFPAKKRMAGRINGKGYFMTSVRMNDMSGYLNLTLKESNLANNKIIGTLYNSLNLKLDASKPRGHGRAELRFNGTKLEISDFYYYNRGAEIRGTGVIRNLRQGMDSPVEGVVMATTRPFKEIDLPGINILDKFLYLAQREMASVRVDGTLEDTQVKVVALPEIQSILTRLLGGTK